MTGGAGYVLSREAVTRFVSGHGDASKCRPGDEGPEDVEMSRCLQRLGVNFLDTRDKYGRNRFFHFSGEDALSLSEQVYRPDLSWILNYGIIPLGVSTRILYNLDQCGRIHFQTDQGYLTFDTCSSRMLTFVVTQPSPSTTCPLTRSS